MKRFLLLLLIWGSVLLGAPAPGEARLDPRLHWSTLETAHFLILFHEGGDEVAARAAVIAEEAHQLLSPKLRWEPVDKTRLVLADVADAANGVATPFPFNRIILYLSPPLEAPFSITDREEWLRIVITHEYTHILQLDNVQQGPAFLRSIFGRLYFPNVFQPSWLIEGLATYEETLLSDGGRGRSSYTEMLLRTAVLAGDFPSLAQGAIAPDSWPGGELPYLYGVKFYQYLVAKYGPELPGELSQRYAGRSLPFMVDSTARAAFGSTYKKEWLLWQAELKGEYAGIAQEVTASGLTELTPLRRDGGYTLAPALSPSGDRLAYSSRTPDRSFSLLLATAEGRNSTPLLRRSVTASSAGIAWLPDGSGLIYAKLERDRYDNLFSDLYRYDLTSNDELRLTHGLRTGSPDLSPLSGEIVCTVAHTNGNRLALVAFDGSFVRYLSAPDDPRLFATPRWSPDGKKVAVAVKTPDGRFLLQILDVDGALLTTLPDGGALNSTPAWSVDGALLFFSSDRGGIYNLYAYRLASGELYQVTKVLGGAFSPQATPDGENLLLTTYGVDGFDLARLPLHPEDWQPLATELDPSPVLRLQPPAPLALPATPYSPWSDLRPRYWLPWIGVDELGTQLGLSTSGNDAIDRHSWAASATYGLETHRPAYSLLYRYDGYTPTVQLLAVDQALPYSDFYRNSSGQTGTYWERRRTVGLDLIFPSGGLWSRHELISGLRYENFSATDAIPSGVIDTPAEGTLAGLRLAYSFSNSVRPAKAISPEEGRALTLATQYSAAALGSDFSQRKYTLDWHEYTLLPWRKHQVLATRLFGGLAQGDLLAQRAFQVGGDNLGDLLQGLDGENLSLRGYPINTFRGERVLLASTEYRFPLLNIEAGAGNGPLYFRRLHGAVFAEGADAYDRGGVTIHDIRTAVGGEVRCDLDLGYRLPLTLRLVLAKGLNQGGENQGYFTLWLRF